MGRARQGDGKVLPEGQRGLVLELGLGAMVSGCPLAALSSLAVGLGQCFPTQSLPRLPHPCGTKNCGLVSSVNWEKEMQRGALGRRGMVCRLALLRPV